MTRLLSLAITCCLVACTASTVSFEECEGHATCRTAFGPGSTCDLSSGLCTEPVPFDRCNSSFPENLIRNPGEHTDRVLFGIVFDLSNPTHVARAKSAELAIRDTQQVGGLGVDVGAITCTYQEDASIDDLSANEAAVAIAQYLEDTLGVIAVVGPASSSATTQVFEGTNDMVIISPSATSNSLTSLEASATDETPGRLWRTAGPDAGQSLAIAADMKQRGVNLIAAIYKDDVYGRGLFEKFSEEFEGTVAMAFPYDNDAIRVSATALVANLDVQEVLFIGASAEGSEFLRFANQTPDYDAKTFFFSDSAANTVFLSGISSLSQETLNRIRGTRPAAGEGPVFSTFSSRYNSVFGLDPSQVSFTAHSFDAGWMAMFGAAWSVKNEGGLTRAGTARGLRKLSSGIPVDFGVFGWSVALSQFEQGMGVDVRGASGELNYEPKTEETVSVIGLWGVDRVNSDLKIVPKDTQSP